MDSVFLVLIVALLFATLGLVAGCSVLEKKK